MDVCVKLGDYFLMHNGDYDSRQKCHSGVLPKIDVPNSKYTVISPGRGIQMNISVNYAVTNENTVFCQYNYIKAYRVSE